MLAWVPRVVFRPHITLAESTRNPLMTVPLADYVSTRRER